MSGELADAAFQAVPDCPVPDPLKGTRLTVSEFCSVAEDEGLALAEGKERVRPPRPDIGEVGEQRPADLLSTVPFGMFASGACGWRMPYAASKGARSRPRPHLRTPVEYRANA